MSSPEAEVGTTELSARVRLLESSLQQLREEVRQLRASTSAPKAAAEEAPPGVDVEGHSNPNEEALGGPKPGVAKHLEVDDWDVYEFQRSIWDASMLIGLPPMGRLGSAAVFALLMLTVAMQLVFCGLINDYLTTALISEAKVDDLRSWRVSHAHNIRYMDGITRKSMARQVCDLDDVIWSEGYKALLGTIEDYIPTKPTDPADLALGPLLPYTDVVGPMMCVIALLVWYMTLLKDFDGARGVLRAVALLPRGPHTRLAAGDGAMVLECVSLGRFGIVLGTFIVRCWVHLVLLWSGSLYLVHTISLSDLILNAVGLEVVLTLDSLVYEAFVPSDSKKFIAQLSPLPKPRKRSYAGVDVFSAAGWGCTFSLAIAMLFIFILPQVTLMKDARDTMCGGNVDFVSTVGNNGLVVVYPSAGTASVVNTYEYDAIHEAIFAKDGIDRYDAAASLELSSYAFGLRGSQRSVQGTQEMSVARATLIANTYCMDFNTTVGLPLPGQEELLRSVFRVGDGVAAGDLCLDWRVTKECAMDTNLGVRARQYCPWTCGCAFPNSSLILTHPDEGCPSVCPYMPFFTERLTPSVVETCEDNAISSSAWQAYGQGLRDLNASWTGPWQTYITFLYDYAFQEEKGCQAVELFRQDLALDLCARENPWHLRPWTYICPETCRCASEPKIGCPDVCR